MSPLADVRAAVPPPDRGRPGLFRWVCTNNPFYVLSAGLFLAGLYASFGGRAGDVDAWALLAGLAAYALLLAVTACLLVRFGNVWDDVRTVLLLVVLMFLATSVTLDEVLVLNPERGVLCSLAALAFAVAVSEAVLRGARLKLPSLFRAPYYVILSLFFLYPMALAPQAADPHSPALLWGLFGFCPAAGLAFLTLLPAVRRGPAYVRANGSPWRWPLYPWALFALLGLAVPARAFLLCWSMHLLGPSGQLVFGPYFLIPFGLAVAVLLLEIGLVAGCRVVLAIALAAPAGLTALALVGHRSDPVYQELLADFTALLGSPLSLALLASAAFYAYAHLRRASLAADALTAALAALAFVGPHTQGLDDLVGPRPLPILAAAAVQLGLGLRRRDSRRSLLGGAGLAAFATLSLPADLATSPARELIAFHLALLVLLVVGAEFDDGLARALRVGAAVLALLACLAATFLPLELPGLPPWAPTAYPPTLALLLVGYGLLLRQRLVQALAGLGLACWLLSAGSLAYAALRQVVAGLDQIALSLALFGLALLISLAKSGALLRWLADWGYDGAALAWLGRGAPSLPQEAPATPDAGPRQTESGA